MPVSGQPRVSNQFIDPAGARATYAWPINHNAEDPVGKHRNIRVSAPTAHVGLVKHLDDTDPLILRWKGVMLTKAQVLETWAWFQMCESQTIYVQDFAGDKYEVLIVHFDPVRRRVMWNDKDAVNSPYHVWDYTLEMHILGFLAGVMAAAGVTP